MTKELIYGIIDFCTLTIENHRELVQSGRMRALEACGAGSNPALPTYFCSHGPMERALPCEGKDIGSTPIESA